MLRSEDGVSGGRGLLDDFAEGTERPGHQGGIAHPRGGTRPEVQLRSPRRLTEARLRVRVHPLGEGEEWKLPLTLLEPDNAEWQWARVGRGNERGGVMELESPVHLVVKDHGNGFELGNAAFSDVGKIPTILEVSEPSLERCCTERDAGVKPAAQTASLRREEEVVLSPSCGLMHCQLVVVKEAAVSAWLVPGTREDLVIEGPKGLHPGRSTASDLGLTSEESRVEELNLSEIFTSTMPVQL
jgi:hypothetical protein